MKLNGYYENENENLETFSHKLTFNRILKPGMPQTAFGKPADFISLCPHQVKWMWILEESMTRGTTDCLIVRLSEECLTHLVRVLSTTSVYHVAGVSPETAASQRQVTLARFRNTQSIRRGGLVSAYEVGVKTEDEINGMELTAWSSTSTNKERETRDRWTATE